SIALLAAENGFKELVVPMANVKEGSLASGINVRGAADLSSLIHELNTGASIEQEHLPIGEMLENAYINNTLDFKDVCGQEKAKRATMIAVAGFHNLLYIGPPGSGITMMACRIPSILNCMTEEECLELTKIYSVMGMLDEDSLMLNRPFRAPHQSITSHALVGGGMIPKPGEITLAHKGVLFLDEIAEYKRDVIEDLRLPVQDKKITINRMSGQVILPADFMLVLAANPCKCGYYPDRKHCRCTEADVEKYLGKIKGPILDRVDICVGTSKPGLDDLKNRYGGISSADMRSFIAGARSIQMNRFKNLDIDFNSQMNRKQIEEFCKLEPRGADSLNKAYEKLNLTARGYYMILKVSRTIADLEGSELILRNHVLEAIGYRNMYINN
ncbi:MAG: YifB family Mg chelatase-like AAA ATPase, partial [Parasporobacterium sp.]|nr:YifB family Mg chelatase-like AAA ATPase [Parasporobacterium sp.]